MHTRTHTHTLTQSLTLSHRVAVETNLSSHISPCNVSLITVYTHNTLQNQFQRLNKCLYEFGNIPLSNLAEMWSLINGILCSPQYYCGVLSLWPYLPHRTTGKSGQCDPIFPTGLPGSLVNVTLSSPQDYWEVWSMWPYLPHRTTGKSGQCDRIFPTGLLGSLVNVTVSSPQDYWEVWSMWPYLPHRTTGKSGQHDPIFPTGLLGSLVNVTLSSPQDYCGDWPKRLWPHLCQDNRRDWPPHAHFRSL